MTTTSKAGPRRRPASARRLMAAVALAPALALANIPPIPFHELHEGDDLADALAELRMAETAPARRAAADEARDEREAPCAAPTPIPEGGRRLP